jgi:methylated-DNA-[protein]-cysteine S-methyltransferase
MPASAPVVRFSLDTPLPSGRMRVAASEQGVIWAAFHEDDTVLRPEGLDLEDVCADRRAAMVAERYADYFAGRRRGLELPIDWSLTSGLQRRVLQCLYGTVGYGETITYGELAERCGAFDAEAARGPAARIVGTLMGTTPIAILLPAHRVVAADGLGGFGSGPDALPTKRWLLTLEGSLAPTLDWDGPDPA